MRYQDSMFGTNFGKFGGLDVQKCSSSQYIKNQTQMQKIEAKQEEQPPFVRAMGSVIPDSRMSRFERN